MGALIYEPEIELPERPHYKNLDEIAKKTLLIMDEVKEAISNWDSLAKNAGVGATSLKMVQRGLDHVAKFF